MHTLRQILLCTLTAALCAGCGGGNPNEATDTPTVVAAAPGKAAAQRKVAQGGAVIAGVATTQDAVDGAIASHAANAASQR